MESEEETDCKKKLDKRKKHLQRQLRDIEKLADMDQVLRNRQKESWKEELEEDGTSAGAPEDAEFAGQEEEPQRRW